MRFVDNRYQLQDPLGQGGMGTVYRAFDRLTQQAVALKKLNPPTPNAEVDEMMTPALHYQALAHEFRIHASLRHPNIISVLDYGFTADHEPFFTMELLETPQTIFQVARETDTRGKIDLLIQTLQAVAYLHRHGVLHRDLKPSNILVTEYGEVKVVDFGVAVDRDEEQEAVGTVFYSPPEVIMQDVAVEASDLYALGVIAYELFTGKRPFSGQRLSEVFQQIVTAEPDWRPFQMLALRDRLIPPIVEVIARLLEKLPENRYPDALSTLRAFCEAIGDPLPPDEGALRESFLQAAKFVGREPEMEYLGTALRQATMRQGSGWLIGGESGVGKSRLLDEIRTRALTDGMVVLRGQVSQAESITENAWVEIMRPLCLSLTLKPEEGAVLKNLIPDLEDLTGYTYPDGGDLQHLPEVIFQLVNRIQQPTLIILEDLHWATISLDPLWMIIPTISRLPIFLLGSYRTEETPHLPDKLPAMKHLFLDRLTDQSIAQLSVSMLGQAGNDPQLVEFLRRETEGNAFFMVEVVRALAEEAGLLDAVGYLPLPQSILTGGIAKIIQRRLARVPDWAYDGLQLAALMGRHLDLPVLDKVLSPILSLIVGDDISVSVSSAWRQKRGLKLDDWLLLCADAGILTVRDTRWEFSHDKLREQILATMSPQAIDMFRRQIEKAR